VIIRSARITDAKEIHRLIEHYANKREMLHRSLNAIFESIQEFIVIKTSNKNNNIIGCGALHISWEDLAEIRSLAIVEKYQKIGFGRKLVAKLQNKAKKLDIKRIFTLTFKPQFFIKLGYNIIVKEALPHKIWSECVNCYLFPDCGEVSLLKII
jgi:amino-acid N-acetyltransferase